MIKPLNPIQFLSVAQELAKETNDEAKLRIAVGRAYYALFLIAREKTGVVATDNVHTEVIRALRRQGYRPLARQLQALKMLRVVADYQLLPDNPTHRDWRRNWSISQAIINQILPKLRTMTRVQPPKDCQYGSLSFLP
jgi:hypothetical protein